MRAQGIHFTDRILAPAPCDPGTQGFVDGAAALPGGYALEESPGIVDYFNGVASWQADHLDQLLGTNRLLIGDLILAELLQGFERDKDHARARDLLADLPYADLVGRDLALAAAENHRKLRRRGVTVRKTIDVIIGTFCILDDHELLHADRDFDPMEKYLGLRVAHRPQ